jgi:hypothetical protein
MDPESDTAPRLSLKLGCRLRSQSRRKPLGGLHTPVAAFYMALVTERSSLAQAPAPVLEGRRNLCPSLISCRRASALKWDDQYCCGWVTRSAYKALTACAILLLTAH